MQALKAMALAFLIVVVIFAVAGLSPAQEESAAPPGEPAAPAEAAAPEPARGITIGQIIQWGGGIGYIIIALSVLTIMLVVKSFFTLRRTLLVPSAVQEQIEQLFRQRKIKEALEACRQDGSLLARVIEAGLTKVRGGWTAMETVMTDVAEEEGLRMQQQVGWFSLIAAVAPMLGLLGTVVGMIGAFYKIAQQTEIKSAGPMAGDIQQALVTTCFGLIVAIPNVWAYTAFRNRLERLMMELSIVASELMTPFKGLRPVTAVPRPAARPAAASVAAAAAGAATEKETDKAPEAAPSPAPEKKAEPAPAAEATEPEAAEADESAPEPSEEEGGTAEENEEAEEEQAGDASGGEPADEAEESR